MPFCKKPQNFETKVWQWFHGQGGHPFGANPRNHLGPGVEPQAKAVKFGQVVFFFSGEGAHIMSKKNKGNKLCPPKKNIRSDTRTHTPGLNVKKVKIMEGLLGCPSNIFWYFLMIFAQTAFLRGRPTVIVENCSHGLYQNLQGTNLRKSNAALSSTKDLRVSVWPWHAFPQRDGVWDHLKLAAGSFVWLRVWHELNGGVGSVCQRCRGAQFWGRKTAPEALQVTKY